MKNYILNFLLLAAIAGHITYLDGSVLVNGRSSHTKSIITENDKVAIGENSSVEIKWDDGTTTVIDNQTAFEGTGAQLHSFNAKKISGKNNPGFSGLQNLFKGHSIDKQQEGGIRRNEAVVPYDSHQLYFKDNLVDPKVDSSNKK